MAWHGREFEKRAPIITSTLHITNPKQRIIKTQMIHANWTCSRTNLLGRHCGQQLPVLGINGGSLAGRLDPELRPTSGRPHVSGKGHPPPRRRPGRAGRCRLSRCRRRRRRGCPCRCRRLGDQACCARCCLLWILLCLLRLPLPAQGKLHEKAPRRAAPALQYARRNATQFAGSGGAGPGGARLSASV
jgi:hypothetical protein